MMKKHYILFSVLISTSLFAQDFQWAKKAGSWAYDYGYGICNDASGNVYVAGKYEENAMFDGVTVTCQGNHDVFIAKYNATGTLQWVRTGGGLSGDYAHGVACDPSGNVYIAGEIEGTVTFSGITVNGNPGTDDAFVAKYNTNGDLQWIKSYGGGSRDDARCVAVDALGNSYILGAFRDAAYFGAFTINSASSNIDDVYIAKLDASGNVVWVKAIGGVGDDTGKSIAIDGSGNVYAVGGFIGTANFDGLSLTAPNGYRDVYLVKWDNNGNLLWVKQGGGEYDDVAWAVTVDNSDNAYITGEFNAYATFGSAALTTGGNADVFVAKYTSSGNILWANRLGENLNDRARGIATDNSNVYVTGQFGGTINVGSYSATSSDSSDIFVASFSTAGAPSWLVTPKGLADSVETLGFEAGNAISVKSGIVYVTGSHLENDSFNGIVLNEWSRTDIFIGSIDPAITPGVTEMNRNQVFTFEIFPNPSEAQ